MEAILVRSLPVVEAATHPTRLPSRLKRNLPRRNENFFTQGLLGELRLENLYEKARCPYHPDCSSLRT